MKRLRWVGTARADLRHFPDVARQRAGFQLHLVQLGLNPDDWKPMPTVGPGVMELRVHAGGEHRVFYVAKYAEAVYVLHAFEKKTGKTAQRDIVLGRKRLAEVHQWQPNDQ